MWWHCILRKNLNAGLLENDVNYICAQQSFFPNELRELIYEIPNGIDFGIKISNRPLGYDIQG